MWLLDLPGPTFALAFLGITAAANAAAYVVSASRRAAQERGGRTDLQLDAYQVALLESRQRAVEAALTSLRQARVLVWEDRWVAGPNPVPGDAHPLEKAVAAKALEVTSAFGVIEGWEVSCELSRMETEMVELGFLSRSGGNTLPFLISFAAPALGCVKIVVGLSRLKPVGFLILLTVVSIIPAMRYLTQERLSPLGKRLAASLRGQNEGLRATAFSNPESLSARDVALAAAMFGVGFLGYNEIVSFFQPVYSSSSFSSSSSSSSYSSDYSSSSSCSSSSSSCGSSGCGSSCGGGGGCGGCGSS